MPSKQMAISTTLLRLLCTDCCRQLLLSEVLRFTGTLRRLSCTLLGSTCQSVLRLLAASVSEASCSICNRDRYHHHMRHLKYMKQHVTCWGPGSQGGSAPMTCHALYQDVCKGSAVPVNHSCAMALQERAITEPTRQ